MAGLLASIKRRLERNNGYRLARQVKWYLEGAFQQARDPRRKVISLQPEGRSRGNVLLFHVNDAFLLPPGQPVPTSHTHYWETLEIARTFLERGYSFDVVHFLNREFTPEKDYAVVIDVRRNLERIAPLLDPACVKIMHADTAHILFHNAAEAARLLALQQRRGVTLQPRRWEIPNLAIEHADCATVLGNDFTLGTYRYANKPLHRLSLPAAVQYPAPRKDFDACRRRFVWFGSGGMVHKGVDLLLEAFAEMPGFHLTLCGPVQAEEDFARAYHKELFETENIRTLGWVDLDGPEFLDVLNNSLALVYPSCSEGQSGAVVTCLHAGLIPIASCQSGVDLEGFGVALQDCSIEEIKESVRRLSELPALELKERSEQAWSCARARYTRENYSQVYRKAMDEILSRDGRQERFGGMAVGSTWM